MNRNQYSATMSIADAQHERGPLPDWRLAPVAEVQQRIAHAALPNVAHDAPTLGTIRLESHQQDAAVRVREAIAQFGGALLADEVGLGKTYVALAIARHYQHCCVITPAALLPMWRNAIRHTEASGIQVRSLQALSGRNFVRPALDRQALIIVDEAHHLRTRHTLRYQRAAQLTAAHDVLLLTATPLHNTTTELRALLALFLGERADAVDDQTLAALVVRRTHLDVPSAQLPAVVEHAPWPVHENTPVLEALLTLPPPLPARNGAAAGALVRLGLLRAWCSSDAALSDALRRRRLRGEALLHALAHGRHPTRHELRSWTTGSDAVQLGFPELLVSTTIEATGGALPQMLAHVTTHLSALECLERLHLRTASADAERSARLRNLLREEPQTPILAFSQFASTVKALYRALADVAGVASLTSHGGQVAGGPLTRQEVVTRFAPLAHERPPPPPHEAIRLLIATDVLSEGINLQDAGRLVHVDLPWTAAARAQRVGRLARIGSLHREIHVHAMAPPPGADATLRLVAALERKAGIAERYVGHNSLESVGTSAGVASIGSASHYTPGFAPRSAPDGASRLRRLLQAWRTLPEPPPVDGQCLVALAPARASGWIAAILDRHDARIAADMARSSRDPLPAPDVTPFAVATILCAIDALIPPAAAQRAIAPIGLDAMARITQAMQDVLALVANNAVANLAGPSPHTLADVRRQLLDLIAQAIANCPPVRRHTVLELATTARRVVMQARGVGAEDCLRHWRAHARVDRSLGWLDHWRRFPVLSCEPSPRDIDDIDDIGSGQAGDTNAQVLALLLLVPP